MSVHLSACKQQQTEYNCSFCLSSEVQYCRLGWSFSSACCTRYLGLNDKHSVATSCVFVYIQQVKESLCESACGISFCLNSLLFHLPNYRLLLAHNIHMYALCVPLFLFSSPVICASRLFLLRSPLVGSILDVKSSICFPAQCPQGAFSGLLLHLCTL